MKKGWPAKAAGKCKGFPFWFPRGIDHWMNRSDRTIFISLIRVGKKLRTAGHGCKNGTGSGVSCPVGAADLTLGEFTAALALGDLAGGEGHATLRLVVRDRHRPQCGLYSDVDVGPGCRGRRGAAWGCIVDHHQACIKVRQRKPRLCVIIHQQQPNKKVFPKFKCKPGIILF